MISSLTARRLPTQRSPGWIVYHQWKSYELHCILPMRWKLLRKLHQIRWASLFWFQWLKRQSLKRIEHNSISLEWSKNSLMIVLGQLRILIQFSVKSVESKLINKTFSKSVPQSFDEKLKLWRTFEILIKFLKSEKWWVPNSPRANSPSANSPKC